MAGRSPGPARGGGGGAGPEAAASAQRAPGASGGGGAPAKAPVRRGGTQSDPASGKEAPGKGAARRASVAGERARAASKGSTVSGDKDGVRGQAGSNTLQELRLAPETAAAAQEAWREFCDSFPTREDAGDKLYAAILLGLPELQKHFVTPKAVHSMRLLRGIGSVVSCCHSEGELLQTVEGLGFMHLHLEVVTEPRVAAFRSSVVDLVAGVLGDGFPQQARDGLTAVLDYAGGASIYARTFYAKRLELLARSWELAQDQGHENRKLQKGDTEEFPSSGSSFENYEEQRELGHRASRGNLGDAEAGCLDRLRRLLPSGRRHAADLKADGPRSDHHESGHVGQADQVGNLGGSAGQKSGAGNHSEAGEKVGGQRAPQVHTTSFEEMFEVNATVMGCGKDAKVWMHDILKSFDDIVSNITNLHRFKEEIKVVALRMSKHPEAGAANLSQFRACMLAALRSLLPRVWTTSHEEAWCWLWDRVATSLRKNVASIPAHAQCLSSQIGGQDETERYGFRRDIYTRFFEIAPEGQDFFKQSNTRLHFIADRILVMTIEIFHQPKTLLSEISALGLRHVGFGIPTHLFPPFVNACVHVMRSRTKDGSVNEAFRWSLSLISQILVRTINEGSTVVMQAINRNSVSQLKRAIAKEPRGRRFQSLLDVHVGEQHISPLDWAIESGSLRVAEAILRDLLTIRADRAKYYYGVDELFGRHPDIVKKISEEAMTLLMTLLDGLVWRSHRTSERPEGTMRRCNYFLKHVLVAKDGGFSDSLQWISAAGDPAFVSHPVISKILDMLWGGVVYRSFIISRMWNMVGLIVFLMSQEVLERHFEQSAQVRYMVLAGRIYTYIIGMGRLITYHLGRIWTWCRDTMRRIIQEIDTDGNGSIDREEMVEALRRFKDTVGAEIRKALRVLRDDDGAGGQDEARKAIANKEKNTYNIISFALMLVLALMLPHEPLIWCLDSPDWPTTQCPDADKIRHQYSVLAMMAMAVHWFILIDLAVFNTQISAFLLVIGQVTGEVKQFLMAICFLLLMFGSAISIMCRNCPTEGGNYDDMPNAIVTLFAITVSLYQGDFRQIDESPVLLLSVFTFLTVSVILLLNLLIAQINRSYEYIYKDMLGFARLNRASLIVDAMKAEQKKPKWHKYVASLKLDERVEFDEGDLGLAGCIQILEEAKLHRQLTESIHRYGGTSSPLEPWPEDKSELQLESNEERLDRLDAMIQKALAKFHRSGAQPGDPPPGEPAAGSDSESSARASLSPRGRAGEP